VQLEAAVETSHDVGETDAQMRGRHMPIEVRVHYVHVAEEILTSGELNRIDPDEVASHHELSAMLRARGS
jgi:hypothetical protein